MFLIGVYATILGSIIGSFFNVVVLRGLSFKNLLGHSKCPNCSHNLDFVDLIPIFGWFIRGGKCKYCKKSISFRYALNEILSGGIFLLVALFIFQSDYPIYLLILLSIFAVVFLYLAIYDIWKYEIPAIGAIVLLVLGFIYKILIILEGIDYPDFWWLITFLLAIGVIFIVSRLYKKQVFGGGDYLIMMAMALISDAVMLFISYELAIIIAAAFGLLMILKDRVNIRSYKIPLVPFLLVWWVLDLNFAEDYFNYLFQL